MRRILAAAGIPLVLTLGTGASAIESAPIANDVLIELEFGGFAAIAFDFAADTFATVNFIGEPVYDGATDTVLNIQCFCNKGWCSCSTTVTAGQETGTITFEYTVQDSDGLESNAATVTLIVGSVEPDPLALLNQLRFIVDRARTGEQIRGGIARSLTSKIGAMGTLFSRDQHKAASNLLSAFDHEVSAQAGQGVSPAVADVLLSIVPMLHSSFCPIICEWEVSEGPYAQANGVFTQEPGLVAIGPHPISLDSRLASSRWVVWGIQGGARCRRSSRRTV